MRNLTLTFSVIAVVAVCINFWKDAERQQQTVTVLSPVSSRLANEIAGAAHQIDVSGKTDAVFLVQNIKTIEGEEYWAYQGTAFLVDSKCGIFATNAHVAEELSAKSRLVLRQPGLATEIPVTSIKIHPAYTRLREISDDYGPIMEFKDFKAQKGSSYFVPFSQFDAALLYTQNITSKSACTPLPGVTLPQPLKLAAQDRLHAIKLGDPIAVIGFPGDGNFGTNIQPVIAQPRIDFGSVRAIGSQFPVPNGKAAASPRLDTVLFHSANTVGGSSGSPILALSGEVIAIHARSSASTGNGQHYQEGSADRVDAIQELLDGTADAALPDYEKQINARFANYLRLEQTARDEAIKSIKETADRFGLQGQVGKSNVYDLDFSEPKYQICMTGDKICISAIQMSNDFEKGRFSTGEITLNTSKINVLTAVDFDLDVDYTDVYEAASSKFQAQRNGTEMCPLVIAEIVLPTEQHPDIIQRKSRHETYASLVIPASHKGEQKIKVTVFRPTFCSSKFLKAKMVLTPFDLNSGPPPADVSVLESMTSSVALVFDEFKDAILPASWRRSP